MSTDRDDYALDSVEAFWRDHQPWLLEQGYQLRSRYQQDWTPSWLDKAKLPLRCEDFYGAEMGTIVDATRISDDRRIILKRVDKSLHSREVEVSSYFSSEHLGSDPDNACVPILDSLDVPGEAETGLLVLPLLRHINEPHFKSFSEALFCIRQLFIGLRFMHKHHVAHLDCSYFNVMMDARKLYPYGFFPHPYMSNYLMDLKTKAKPLSRTDYPPRYYLIDFGESRKFDKEEPHPTVDPATFRAGDRSVPEFAVPGLIDPFAVDVYSMGNIVRKVFLEGEKNNSDVPWTGYYGFDFLGPLVAKMTSTKPEDRPSMEDAVRELDGIIQRCSVWKLHSPLYSRRESLISRISRQPADLIRTLYLVTRHIPALPTEPCIPRD